MIGIRTGFASVAAFAAVLATGCTARSSPPAEITFHCGMDDRCPEVMVEGDPHATIDGKPAPFRGYGDPSLEFDPENKTLWLSYSWLDVLVGESGPPPKVDFGVRTHLAKSEDRGKTFRFVKAINETTRETDPDSERQGWAMHEVSTLVRKPEGWQILWLRYFEPFGPPPPERSQFRYVRSRVAAPEQLGDEAEEWIRGPAASAKLGVKHNLSAEISALADCTAFTEPALFLHGEATYLATGCIVFAGGARRPERERVALLREEEGGYRYVGVLLNGGDARRIGADVLEQADLSVSRNGGILLTVTPIRLGKDPAHQGCVVYEVEDFETARVKRDADGRAVPRATITADGNGLGPGLCTYDAASETGVLLVMTRMDTKSMPPDILFSLRATGVHP